MGWVVKIGTFLATHGLLKTTMHPGDIMSWSYQDLRQVQPVTEKARSVDPSPPALPSFTATLWSSYKATGKDCDVEHCDKPRNSSEFFQQYEHTRVATLRLYYNILY